MKDRNAIIKRIDRLEGKEQMHLEWLLSLLDHSDSIVRFAAIRPLIYRCYSPNLTDKLLLMLGVETDPDVLLLVISALSERCRGSKDAGMLMRFQEAIERVGGGGSGTRENFQDAQLKVMLGLDTKQLLQMSSEERNCHLNSIKHLLCP